ncbi:MAG: fructose-1,6-bisphosphatase [Gemmiger sp.]
MQPVHSQVPGDLKYLALLARDYPTQAAASSEVIKLQALMKLPKGTEHFVSDLHGEDEAFVHILNSASGVIREKVDAVLGDSAPAQTRAELATLIYYPVRKLPQLKARCADENARNEWYRVTLLRLIDISRLVSSKHTREYVRSCLPSSCGYILDELLHAHFEDHDKALYYGQIVGSIIENGRADNFIIRLCQLIKRLAVDKLHIVGDLFDRGPRPDVILDRLMVHHHVDFQWGNHDVVWMGAAAGSPLCCCTVLKTTLAYHNHGMIEDRYGINLRHLLRFAEQWYGNDDLTLWMPHTDASRGPYTDGMLHRCAVMHKAITILMLKLECEVIDRNPDFKMEGRDFLRRIDWQRHTVRCGGREYPLRDASFPTVDPADPARLHEDEIFVLDKLVDSFTHSERLQRHVAFLYAKGGVYHIENNNLLYHGVVPMTADGEFAEETFEGRAYKGRALLDYCDARARRGYFAPEGSEERRRGQDFLWYLWCGRLSPLFGRSAMTTFERLYIADPETHREIKDPYYTWYNDAQTCGRILAEFGLTEGDCHIVNGHVPVREKEGESPIKGGGRLLVIDGGFCRAYHEKTGIAGYTLVYSSHGMSLRTHQPFETAEKAVRENLDILSRVDVVDFRDRRVLVENTDEGREIREKIADLRRLIEAYRAGLLKEQPVPETLW